LDWTGQPAILAAVKFSYGKPVNMSQLKCDIYNDANPSKVIR